MNFEANFKTASKKRSDSKFYTFKLNSNWNPGRKFDLHQAQWAKSLITLDSKNHDGTPTQKKALTHGLLV